jgi:hypothetical protein
VARASTRTTLTYALTPALRAGLEWNPAADDVGILANWRLLDETDTRPALIVGTSSDRIGTEDGRAFYGTLSKSLDETLGWPVSPYVGLSGGGSDHVRRGIGGVHVRWSDDWTSSHLWDGVNLHHLLDRRLGAGQSVGLVLAEQDGEHFVGLSWSWSFGLGGDDHGAGVHPR